MNKSPERIEFLLDESIEKRPSCPEEPPPASITVKRSKVLENFSWLIASEIAARGLAFVSTIYLARVLGSAQFGVLSFATAFLAYGTLLADFGLSTYGTREIARDRTKLRECVANIQSTRLAMSLVVFTVASILAWALLDKSQVRLLFIFSFLWLFPYSLGLDWVFRGLEKMGYSALWNFLQQGVFILLLLLFVHSSAGLAWVALYKALGCAVASVALIVPARKLIGGGSIPYLPTAPNWQVARPMIMKALPLAAAYLLGQIYWSIGTIILGFIDTPEAIGIYAASYRVILLAVIPCYTITNAFYPKLAYDFLHDHAGYARRVITMLTVVTAAGTIIMLTIYLGRGFVVAKLYGAEYKAAANVLPILCLAILGEYVCAGFGGAFVSAGFERIGLISTFLGAVTNIALNVALIPHFGYMGAAAATAGSFVVMVIFYLTKVRLILKGEQHA